MSLKNFQLGGNNVMNQAQLDITDSQIRNLVGTRLVIIPPNPHSIILPIMASFQFEWFANYGNIQPTSELFIQGITPVAWQSLQKFEEAGGNAQITGIFAAGGSTLSTLGTAGWIGPSAAGSAIQGNWGFGVPLTTDPIRVGMGNAGNLELTGGDSRNRLRVTVFYVLAPRLS